MKWERNAERGDRFDEVVVLVAHAHRSTDPDYYVAFRAPTALPRTLANPSYASASASVLSGCTGVPLFGGPPLGGPPVGGPPTFGGGGTPLVFAFGA